MSKLHWSQSDARCALSVPSAEFDPRIHFALVCGAKSCPPIRIFSPANLESALMMASKAFCGDNVVIDVSKRLVTLSMILKWYGKDFGKTRRDRCLALVPYLSEEKTRAMRDLLLAVDQPELACVLSLSSSQSLSVSRPRFAEYVLVSVTDFEM